MMMTECPLCTDTPGCSFPRGKIRFDAQGSRCGTVVGAGQVEEQRSPNAEWILQLDVEVTQNDDSTGVESKPEGEGVG